MNNDYRTIRFLGDQENVAVKARGGVVLYHRHRTLVQEGLDLSAEGASLCRVCGSLNWRRGGRSWQRLLEVQAGTVAYNVQNGGALLEPVVPEIGVILQPTANNRVGWRAT
jgi:hypothetical protein